MSKLLYKILGTPIGGFSSDKVPKDGDGDGMFTLADEDNVPLSAAVEIVRKTARNKVRQFEKANPKRVDRIREMLAKAKGGGFTVNKTKKDDVVTGISIGRNKFGIKKPESEMYDKDGQPTDEAVRLVMSWLTFHGEEVFASPLEGAREVGIGGWIEDDMFYVDIVDIYDNNKANRAKAVERGKAQNQIAVADLDEIQKALKTNDWSKAMILTGGDGSETLSISTFDDISKVYNSIPPGFRLGETEPPKQKSVTEQLASMESFRILIVNDAKRGN